MARTKTTPNTPPPIDYNSLYRWVPNDLLAETSQITSFKDIAAYKESGSDEKFRIFGREHDPCASMIAQTLKNPSSSCTPQSSNGSSFAYHLRVLSARSWLRWTWPLPSWTPKAGPLCRPLPFSATTLAIRHRWTFSSTSSRQRTLERGCGWASTELRGKFI